uniref:AB hydrolase-1 domain-containing protein n=1 Tax=Mycena chlorophos TaxID=658473 RepID=A0ABQ0LEK5_MYCCL|nr:predicted protein [Mycena chlorophos]
MDLVECLIAPTTPRCCLNPPQSIQRTSNADLSGIANARLYTSRAVWEVAERRRGLFQLLTKVASRTRRRSAPSLGRRASAPRKWAEHAPRRPSVLRLTVAALCGLCGSSLESGVTSKYTDNGPLEQNDAYPTLFVIHGYTFHAGTFQRLHPRASDAGLRVICLNRREYDDSSLYPGDELALFKTGTVEQRAMLLTAQGRDLALCIDGIIQSLALPKAGGVALMAWSMGNTFLLSVFASLDALPKPTKERLVQWVHTAIILKAPAFVFGIPPAANLLVPHADPTIPESEKGPAFANWFPLYEGILEAQTERALYGDTGARDRGQLATNRHLPPRVLHSASTHPRHPRLAPLALFRAQRNMRVADLPTTPAGLAFAAQLSSDLCPSRLTPRGRALSSKQGTLHIPDLLRRATPYVSAGAASDNTYGRNSSPPSIEFQQLGLQETGALVNARKARLLPMVPSPPSKALQPAYPQDAILHRPEFEQPRDRLGPIHHSKLYLFIVCHFFPSLPLIPPPLSPFSDGRFAPLPAFTVPHARILLAWWLGSSSSCRS